MTFFFNTVINASNVDEDVASVDSRLEVEPFVRGRVALAARIAASVVDRNVLRLQCIQRTVQVSGFTGVVTYTRQ